MIVKIFVSHFLALVENYPLRRTEKEESLQCRFISRITAIDFLNYYGRNVKGTG